MAASAAGQHIKFSATICSRTLLAPDKPDGSRLEQPGVTSSAQRQLIGIGVRRDETGGSPRLLVLRQRRKRHKGPIQFVNAQQMQLNLSDTSIKV